MIVVSFSWMAGCPVFSSLLIATLSIHVRSTALNVAVSSASSPSIRVSEKPSCGCLVIQRRVQQCCLFLRLCFSNNKHVTDNNTKCFLPSRHLFCIRAILYILDWRLTLTAVKMGRHSRWLVCRRLYVCSQWTHRVFSRHKEELMARLSHPGRLLPCPVPYNLYCVGADVKLCSINQSTIHRWNFLLQTCTATVMLTALGPHRHTHTHNWVCRRFHLLLLCLVAVLAMNQLLIATLSLFTASQRQERTTQLVSIETGRRLEPECAWTQT